MTPQIISCSQIPKRGAHEQCQWEAPGNGSNVFPWGAMPGRISAKLGSASKTFCASWSLVPSPTHGGAFAAWPLTCTHGNHECPAPQNGQQSHSLAPRVFSSEAVGQGQENTIRSIRWQLVADTLGPKLKREWLFRETHYFISFSH